MRKYFSVLMIAFIALFAFVSCNDSPAVKNGEVRISIADTSRGISPEVSMYAQSYNIKVKDSNGSVQYETTVSRSVSNCSFRLPVGMYSIEVDAFNEDSIRIGSGLCQNAEVVAGRVNSFRIAVSELAGKGMFSVNISANAGYDITLKVYDGDDDIVYSNALVYSEETGRYTIDGELLLDNGFYRFEILRGDAEKPLKNDTVRIVKDRVSIYSASFSFVSGGSVIITDEILSTPSIVIEVEEEEVSQNGTVHASAVISGISGEFTSCWYVDERRIGEYGPYADLEHVLVDAEVGVHTIALFITSDSVVWSESVTFEVVEADEVATYSLSSLQPGQVLEFDADENTDVELKDFSLADGVYVTAVNNTRGLGGASEELDINLFRMDDGSFIPLPNATHSIHFKGLDIGLNGSGTIRIRKFNVQNDLSISASEYPAISAVNGMVSEYYYIDFNDSQWRNLDRSHIVVRQKNAAGEYVFGYSNVKLLQSGYISYNYQMDQIYDLSRQSGFGMYVSRTVAADGSSDISYEISSPEVLALNVPKTIDASDVRIRIPAQVSGNYVVTMRYQDNESFTRAVVDLYRIEFGKADGSYLDTVFYPTFDSESNTITWFIGSLASDCLMSYYGRDDGVVVELKSTTETCIEPTSLSELASGDKVFTKGVSDFITVPFKTEVKTDMYLSGSFDLGTLMFYSPNGHTSWCGFSSSAATNPYVISASARGFIVVRCMDVNDGDVAIVLSENSGEDAIDCDEIVRNGETGGFYCPDCMKYVSLATHKDDLFVGEYVTAGEYSDGSLNYGKITFNPDRESLSAENVLLTLKTGSYGEYRSYNNEDESQWVGLTIDRIVLSPERKIYGTLRIGNNGATYENVEMVSMHSHSWTFGSDAATCTSCKESRAYLDVSIGGEVVMNSDIDGLVVYVPVFDFLVEGQAGDNAFPPVPEGTQVYIIAPSSTYNLTYTMNGQYLAVRTTADRTI